MDRQRNTCLARISTLGSNLAGRARRETADAGLPGKGSYGAVLLLVNFSPVAANPELGMDQPRFSRARVRRSLPSL